MKIIFRLILAFILILPLASFDTSQTLWYNAPAGQWEETLPLGNGRLGMMPDGGIDKEKIVLNEISMWSGSEADYSNPEAAKSLPKIQRLLLQGHNAQAQELMFKSFVPAQGGSGATYGCYQMLADLDIDYTYPGSGAVADYMRRLDLSTAVAFTTFTRAGVQYIREYYVPRHDNIIVMHVRAEKPKSVTFSASINRAERGEVSADDGMLFLSGTLDSGDPKNKGVAYGACVKVYANGGTVSCRDKRITVTSAHEAWVVVTARTNYFDKKLNIRKAILADLPPNTAEIFDIKRFGTLMHRKLYNRAAVTLPATANSSLPTDKRIIAFADADDPELASLYYNYGRYLLISSTLPGCLPPNLQGLWANVCGTPWNGDYHTNINVQMNHWPVEQSNLSELHMPLVDLTCRAVKSGERTAKAFYGKNAKGWVMHMMTNVWGYTEPGEYPMWGSTNTGGAWLCAHLWEHHLYNPYDTEYLRRIYPVMKGAAEFFLSTMIADPSGKMLVTAPSSSPENEFIDPETGTNTSVCMGPTMDIQLVRELFGNTISAAEELGCDPDFRASLQAAFAKLPPHRIGSDDRLLEWMQEYKEKDPQHRHVSHLYGLHPGNQISVINTPELAEACRRTLEVRGDGGTGWSRAWKINFWARLGDGDRAYTLFRSLLAPAYTEPGQQHVSGTFPNLFCSHPPFQIDGNFGGASGISEMLLQSQDGFVNLLPALPSSWAEGEIRGFKVRGGATVDMKWRESHPVSVTVDVPAGDDLVMLMPEGNATARVEGRIVRPKDRFLTLPAGKVSHIEF